jgi:hypothetical protein
MSLQANPDCQHPSEATCKCKDIGELVPAPMLGELTERRSKFVYDAARLAAQAANAPIIPVPWDDREELFKTQFRKVIERQCGEQRSRSPEELHGSWMQAYFEMGWVFGTEYSRENKTHPDLVPYTKLGQLERDKDAVFVALCEIARQWVYSAHTELSDRLIPNA